MTKPTNTSIGPNTRVNGRIAGDTTVDVYGYVRGEIDLRDTLTVHEEGIVDGEVAVDNLVVNGTIRGQLHVRNHLVLTSTARVVATIRTHLFTVEDGARFSGDIETHIGTSDTAKPLVMANTTRRSGTRAAGRPAMATGTYQRSSFIRPNENKPVHETHDDQVEESSAAPLSYEVQESYAARDNSGVVTSGVATLVAVEGSSEEDNEINELTGDSSLSSETSEESLHDQSTFAQESEPHVDQDDSELDHDADEESEHVDEWDEEGSEESEEDLKKKKLTPRRISRRKERRSSRRPSRHRKGRKK